MKTFDRKDVFTVVNAEDAKEYIDQLGYFSDSLYKDLKNWELGVLDNICDVEDFPFIRFGDIDYRLFLPADKVKEVEEKKWRAFKDLDDLKTYASKSVGSVICFRKKDKDDTITTSVITSYIFKTNCICIGNQPFLFETLFQQYELLNEHAFWQPFGVKE